MNNVVIGDLRKYNSKTCMLFDGVDDFVDVPSVHFIKPTNSYEIEIEFSIKQLTNGSIFGMGQYHQGGVSLFIENETVVVGTNIVGVEHQTRMSYMVNKEYELSIIHIGDTEIVVLKNMTDGTEINRNTTLELPDDFAEMNLVVGKGTQGGRTNPTNCIISSFKYTSDDTVICDYDFSGFGALALEDKSGNGNDGVISGAKWWKQGVNENFLTPQLYKSSWIDPMIEGQIVSGDNVIYKQDDLFWNPYNIDSTYKFILSNGERIKTLYNIIGDNIMIKKTIKGSTLSTGINNLNLGALSVRGNVNYILSTSDGIISVKFKADADFTSVSVISDGIFYPFGNIVAVDVDNSTVNINDVVFGIS